jgi:hypothetical protein
MDNAIRLVESHLRLTGRRRPPDMSATEVAQVAQALDHAPFVVRIAKSGRRFMIRRANVWGLTDAHGNKTGQAAMFSDWQAS